MRKLGGRFERYETPPHYLDALQQVIGQPRTAIFDPCVGRGAIVKHTICAKAKAIVTNDLDEKVKADHHLDARFSGSWGLFASKGSWCITNPPFSGERKILQHALQWHRNIALLALISFLEPTKLREKLLLEHPPHELIYLPRYSFAGNGGQYSQTCMWMIWRSAPIPGAAISVAPRPKKKEPA